MSDHASGVAQPAEPHSATPHDVDEHAVTQPTDAVPFDRDDVAQFEADDSHAGVVLGKMLSAFFFFLLLFMICVTLWTRSNSLNTGNGNGAATTEAGGH